MKKLITIIMLTITIPSYATTMCAANDAVAVVLDPTIGGSGTGDSNTGTWRANFSYGYISGISACLNINKGKTKGGWVENLTYTNNNGETKTVVGSERYGRYCWCKATHPISSRWVYASDRGSVSGCSSNCGGGCGVDFGRDWDLRFGLFESVIQ